MIPLGLTREQYDKLSKFVDSNSDLHGFLSMIEEMIRVNETDEQLNEYIIHIESGTHITPEAVELYNKLVKRYGATHQKILDLDKLIRWQKFKAIKEQTSENKLSMKITSKEIRELENQIRETYKNYFEESPIVFVRYWDCDDECYRILRDGFSIDYKSINSLLEQNEEIEIVVEIEVGDDEKERMDKMYEFIEKLELIKFGEKYIMDYRRFRFGKTFKNI